jgi:hypothetical protein
MRVLYLVYWGALEPLVRLWCSFSNEALGDRGKDYPADGIVKM